MKNIFRDLGLVLAGIVTVVAALINPSTPSLLGGYNPGANTTATFSFPSVTQLTNGANCGTVSGVTDTALCMNDIYAASIASTTIINVGPGNYPSSTNTINIGTNGQFAAINCAAGGTEFNYNGTSTAMILNAGNSATLNQFHPGSYGAWNCFLNGPGNTTVNTTTVGLLLGGSSGAEGAVFAYGKIIGFGTGVNYASSSWKTALLYDDISSNFVNWNFPNGLSNTGEAITADHVNFHDNTQTVGTSTYVNCVTPKGGGYFDFEFDNFDDCQFKFTGTGVVRLVDAYFENPGGDANLANYIPLVNAPTSLASTIDAINPYFTNDASAASGTPIAFVSNSTGTLLMENFGVLKNGAATVASFFINSGPGSYYICGGVGNGLPWTSLNGGDNSQSYTNSNTQYLIGCTQSASGNWPTGFVSLGANNIGITDGGQIQLQIGVNGITLPTASGGAFQTGSIGGGSLTAGTCASTTVVLASGVVTSTAAFITTPTKDPGPDFYWETVLVASSSVSTRVCAAGITGTPTASTYNVKIIQ